MHVRSERVIKAPPNLVFAQVKALDRMPERSPEPQRFEWTDGSPGETGTSFRGWNRALGLRWWTNGWITVSDEPSLFRFETSTIYGDRQEHTNRWTYTFEQHPEGTRVTETLETIRLPFHLKFIGPLLSLRARQIEAGMDRTLEHLAKECEIRSD
ncbi:MAG: SRPBCC family protein [Rhizomicrobium sp.]